MSSWFCRRGQHEKLIHISHKMYFAHFSNKQNARTTFAHFLDGTLWNLLLSIILQVQAINRIDLVRFLSQVTSKTEEITLKMP